MSKTNRTICKNCTHFKNKWVITKYGAMGYRPYCKNYCIFLNDFDWVCPEAKEKI